MKLDIHNNRKHAKLSMRRLESSLVSERNKELIKEFVDSLVAEGLSFARIAKYTDSLRYWAKWLKVDFDVATKQEISSVISWMQMSGKHGAWSMKSYKIIIKRFYKWLAGTDEYPSKVRWIKARIKLCEKKLPGSGDLITEEDVLSVLSVVTLPRDKALISMLWESGCRVGELMSLLLGNITIDKFGVVITVSGKTGSRNIRLVSSTPYLMAWLNMHPYWGKNKTRPLWFSVSNHNRNVRMSYQAVNKLLRKYFELAGIDKKCNPHLFRHSRATYLANHLTEFQMNQYFGWRQGSEMPSTYVHLSGKEIDSAILALNGLQDVKSAKQEVKLKPTVCPRCDTLNAHDSKYCSKCAGILDIAEAMRLEDSRQKEESMRAESDALMNRLMKDPEVLRMIACKVRDMGGVKI